MFSEKSDLLILRDLSMILIGFAGFLRFDDLVELRCSDILSFLERNFEHSNSKKNWRVSLR